MKQYTFIYIGFWNRN